MLAYEPEKRIGVTEALEHPYLSNLHDPDDEPSCGSYFEFDCDNEKFVMNEFRDFIFNEVLDFQYAEKS